MRVETQFFYDDATHALPTRVVVDPQNGTGTQTTTTAYDYSTGLVMSQTDVNGQVSTIDYTNQLLGSVDPFGRPGITKAPAVNIGVSAECVTSHGRRPWKHRENEGPSVAWTARVTPKCRR